MKTGLLFIYGALLVFLTIGANVTKYTASSYSYKEWDYQEDTWSHWHEPVEVDYSIHVTDDITGSIKILSEKKEIYTFTSRTLGHVTDDNQTYDKYECTDKDGNPVQVRLFRWDGLYGLKVYAFNDVLIHMYVMELD